MRVKDLKKILATVAEEDEVKIEYDEVDWLSIVEVLVRLPMSTSEMEMEEILILRIE